MIPKSLEIWKKLKNMDWAAWSLEMKISHTYVQMGSY